MRRGLLTVLAMLAACAVPGGMKAGETLRLATNRIAVDQFGYRPGDDKVAVLSDPRTGADAGDRYTPGPVIEVRDVRTGTVAWSGQPTAWKDGAVDPSSGNAGWWVDFSGLRREGTYEVVDPARGVRSSRFRIAEDVYAEALRTAARMYFYNRSGQAKQPPFADPRWADAPAYLGPGQDTQARPVWNKTDPTAERDLSGGWFDAGDTNKYVTFALDAVSQLLTAYSANPAAFPDDWSIPESGNGIPDLLDEVRWELDWLKRMQDPDGGVLIKVGVIDFQDVSPPSADRRPRYYGPACSSSTIAAAAMFAQAATVLRGVPALQQESDDLLRRALAAWGWFAANPIRTDCDTQEIKAGKADLDENRQQAVKVVAAVYLFALTGEARFADAVAQGFRKTWPFTSTGWSQYVPSEGDALMAYASLPTADAAVKAAILERRRADLDLAPRLYGSAAGLDLYRAYMPDESYHWGSNRVRANIGTGNVDSARAGPPDAAAARRERAAGMLHALHGVNPMGLAYVSALGELGPERSASHIYHAWFNDWPAGPAPGYLTGGPNRFYSGPLRPPGGEPAQKAYKDWNGGWPDASWEITEPAIYFQSAYVRLLSAFVGEARVSPKPN